MHKLSAEDFGTDHLRHRSLLAKRVKELVLLDDVLILDDSDADATWLISALKLVCGHDLHIRHARTLGTALDALKSSMPQILFVDDRLSPVDTATSTIPFIRKSGCAAPIVILSGEMTRNRRTLLLELGAVAILHKDDIESARVAELLIELFAPKSTP